MASPPTPGDGPGAAGGPAPALTVVVGARASEPSPAACLAALEAQMGGHVEVILVEDAETAQPVPAGMRRVTRSGGLVPELWAEGVRLARGELVGLLAATVVPDPDWVARTIELHGAEADLAGIGGAIEPGSHLGLADWAVYFLRYAPYMLPLLDPDGLEVPGDNASYRAAALAGVADHYRQGFWEPAVHRALRSGGERLAMRPSRVVRHQPGASPGQVCRQRFAHGRAHGRERSRGLARSRILLESASAPAVPPLLLWRAARTVGRKRRHRLRLVASAPWILAFSTAWAAGELAGRLTAVALAGRPPAVALAGRPSAAPRRE